MAEVDIVRQAKADLEAAGQTWVTSCDAYKITNLAARRAGWKVVQKTSGDNCEGRKVDGLIVDGRVIDCLRSAGPPLNQNEPVWQDLGPQNALVAIDPLPWPDPVKPDPDPDPELPSRDLVQRVERLELQVANQDTRITQLQQQIAGINAATAS